MSKIFRGVLIAQSVPEPEKILEKVRIVDTRQTGLEGEAFRGKVTLYSVEVSADNLWRVLSDVAETIRSPGWYFHLVNSEKLYIVMSKAILIAGNDGAELKNIIEYAKRHGIHADQLNLSQLFDNPFA